MHPCTKRIVHMAALAAVVAALCVDAPSLKDLSFLLLSIVVEVY
jgi:hypothetical protein